MAITIIFAIDVHFFVLLILINIFIKHDLKGKNIYYFVDGKMLSYIFLFAYLGYNTSYESYR